MKKETAIVSMVVIAVASFFLGFAVGGKSKIVASSASDSTAAKEGAFGRGAAGIAKGAMRDIYKVPLGRSPWKGAKDARVTIVEFSEFQCPFCSRVGPTLKQILSAYGSKVKLVFKHNPLNFHQHAQLASEAAMAANAQGKFWQYHDKLFANQRALTRPDLEKYAQEVGLDMDRFKKALETRRFRGSVLADQRLARQIGAMGTPTFFINGRKLSGALPFASFKKVIDEEMARADKLIAAGTPVGNVYHEITKNGRTSRPAPQPRRVATGKEVYRVPLHDSPVKGPADAKITIVEFSEFQCPFCRRVLPTLKQLERDYPGKIRFVFKHNPLPFHKNARGASAASIAAAEQGKFWEYHDKLFANQRALSAADLERYAQEVGLDMNRFRTSIKDSRNAARIARDMAVARRFGAFGTPAFFINGRKISGAQPVAAFKRIIDEELKKADALLGRGIPAGRLYAELTKNGLAKAAPRARPSAARGGNDRTVYRVPVDRSVPCKGPSDALVTVVESSEFQCPFCRRVLPTVNKILDDYKGKTRVCFMHNPLPFHKNAVPAALASIEAHRQGKFWQFHDILFQNQRALDRPSLERYAEQAGLNVSAVKAALDSGKGKSVIQRHQGIASALGARGTPTFFINGRKLVGARPFPSFKTIIDEELRKAEAMVKRGTPASRVYAEIIKRGATKAVAAAPSRGGNRNDSNTVHKIPVPRHASCKGPKHAQITVLEFSEFQCPFCRRVLPTMKQLMDKYAGKARLCFMHNPLPFHKDAPGASKAAIAAHKQGKFWEYHDKLFANQRALKPDDLERYAVEVGLDMSRFKKDMASAATAKVIQIDQALAAKFGARGTPTFFINGRKVVGARPLSSFTSVIDDELRKTSAMLKRGIPMSRLYGELIKRGVTGGGSARPSRPVDNKVYKVSIKGAPLKGSRRAPVTIVEFSDFQCPFCSRGNAAVQRLAKEYPGKVKIAWKHYPLPFHRDAPLAHQASMAAQEQGKFWQYHDKLFANQRALKRPDLERYAQEIGLDMDRFKSALDSGKFKSRIDSDMEDGKRIGVRGTPSFLINGRKLVGAQPYIRFKQMVDAALSKK